MVNFYRQFFPKTTDLQAPLHDILKGPKAKESQFIQWIPELEEAFTVCKDSLATTTLLAHPHPDARLRLFTDTSSQSIGACLQQIIGDNWKLIAFFSKKMSVKQGAQTV
jgi:hypothetical protein